jgi:hypothetical protein
MMVEAALLLILCLWLGYLHLLLANLLKPAITWLASIFAVIAIAAIGWIAFRTAWRRKFRFRLRTLLIAVVALSLIMAFLTTYVSELRTQYVAENAISQILARKGEVTVGRPHSTSVQTRTDWTDPRNAVSIEFSGVTLNDTYFGILSFME